jgi:uncharacterized protein (TIGR02145 family)
MMFVLAFTLNAQNDTMYIIKQGNILGKYKVSDVDSVIFYKPFTSSSTTVTDIDGNVYKTVTIGTQVWMAENLKTTNYNDGSTIPLVIDGWASLTTPGYCWYGNISNNKATYGALYNWYTVNTAKLCPTGWHVPTDNEWTTLENYLIANGFNYDGTTTENKIAKSMAAQTAWAYTDIGNGAIGDNLSLNNKSGFSALPGGSRHVNGQFDSIYRSGNWWSSTEFDTASAKGRGLGYRGIALGGLTGYKYVGWSVRCVKD